MALATLAAALGVGSGFGFATFLTPSGSAKGNVVGFGFLPAKGWMVVQSGTVGSTGAATAIAANTRLDPDDALAVVPSATLDSLPPQGVLVFARFTTRGDPAEDARFAARSLPLLLGDATRVRAGVGGYNVDVRVFFGRRPPSAAARAAAQQQLNRLVVASEPVTIFARPSIAAGSGYVTLFGSVDNRRAGEVVDVQAKDCGHRFFRGVLGATTTDGGAWTNRFYPSINTTLRAVWNGKASAEIAVRKRPFVTLQQRAAGVLTVRAAGGNTRTFGGKRALFQRLDRRLGKWLTVKQIVLRDDFSGTRFTTSLPKGTHVRAVLPLSQTRPCYLAGYSPSLRIGS